MTNQGPEPSSLVRRIRPPDRVSVAPFLLRPSPRDLSPRGFYPVDSPDGTAQSDEQPHDEGRSAAGLDQARRQSLRHRADQDAVVRHQSVAGQRPRLAEHLKPHSATVVNGRH